ncbi:endonuclease MutS2 [Hazenella coriacea]|uniref:Endonuclease MutS2 n=1 Tax=Hazenella coriacea TaxID=1179467 RepID=A0A4R3LBR7_9BACL|nr:endonuclease MutS2 [Hazenella coriacea]TCS96680.1 DNA mismatch repair protein MutS2 [Hazenella coriacea]
MEQWTLNTLEFNHVKEMLKQQASSLLGKEKVDEVVPSASLEEVKERLKATAEGMDLLRLKGDVPLGGIRQIGPSIRRAKIGGILTESELLDIASTLAAGRKLKSSLRQVEIEQATLPILRGYTEQIESLEHLEKTIENAIDDQGVVKDQASSILTKVRHSITRIRQKVNQTLNQMLRSSHYQKMMQEAIITQRYDRYVIPVKQEYRQSFGGIVHDQSASGATLFIEPEAVVQLNNQLREQELAEEKELERILAELTGKVAEETEWLEQNIAILAEVDFIIAKARFGYAKKAVCPIITTDFSMQLKKARHPLIPSEQVVPIDVEMGENQKAIIVTGPNTGGKTVTLKTIGLLALMTQSGFPIPAEEESMMPVYSGVFADIGDEQSIEQNLSTFSGHLTNIIRILKQIDDQSLVLFDELGAGTDPTEGAALAIAILEHVMNKGCTVVATTHYSELKLFAHSHPRALNASVEFDVETLRPTYRLLIGVPGRSNAFAISSRLGLPTQIIDEAKKQLSSEENQLEDMITSLTADRKKSEEDRRVAERLHQEAEHLYKELQQRLHLWEEEKAQIREKAREEARLIVSKAQREAEEVLKQLREWAKERPQAIKEHQLIEAKKRLGEAVPELQVPRKIQTDSLKKHKVEVGDDVFVLRVNQKGTVVEVLGKDEFQVQVGFLKMKVKRDELEKRESTHKATMPKATSSVKRKSDDVRPELDLRGQMVDEAILEIDKYLDDAILAGYKQVSLIHGKGTGALRSGVQDFLRSHPSIKSFRLGSQGEGGSGVTVAELR